MYIPVISTIRHLELKTTTGTGCTPGECTLQLSELIDMAGVKTARVMVRWRGGESNLKIQAMKAWPISDIQYATETAEADPPAPPVPVIAAEVGLFLSDDYTMKTSGPIDSPGPFIVLFLSFQNPTRADVQLDFTVGIEVLPA